MASSSSGPHVLSSGATSGLTIDLHPLAILNISDVFNRAQYTSSGPELPKMIGALLGTESNREVAIVNSFELIYHSSETGDDVEMAEGDILKRKAMLDMEFLETHKQVFPTLDVIGWYTVGTEPTSDDLYLHSQFSSIETPIFLLFNPDIAPGSQNLPIKLYESAVTAERAEEGEGKFVELSYGVETGEAERIAVDGVAKGGVSEDDTAVAHLTTQRNAITMLYHRIQVLLQYVSGVNSGTAKVDHSILRQISSLVATLPTMDAEEFQEELLTQYSDVQLSSYLTSLTRELNALSQYADKHNTLYGQREEDLSAMNGHNMGGRGRGGFLFDSKRRR